MRTAAQFGFTDLYDENYSTDSAVSLRFAIVCELKYQNVYGIFMSAVTPQRSALYVPASNQRAIDKTASINADWVIFDLEDSVSVEGKDAAREALISAFQRREFGLSRAAIRCNSATSIDFPADIETIATCLPDAVLLPKVSSADDVRLYARHAGELAVETDSWFMIETVSGITKLGEIIESAADTQCSLSTLVVGHNDLASESGVSLDHDRRYLIPWLMQIVLHARQAGLQVLDSVWNNYRDLQGFENEALQGKQMGFDGKTLIHPSQVEPATRLFSPSPEEVTRARLIIDTFAQPENSRSNVLPINGEMVERLHLLQAQRLLHKAGLG